MPLIRNFLKNIVNYFTNLIKYTIKYSFKIKKKDMGINEKIKRIAIKNLGP